MGPAMTDMGTLEPAVGQDSGWTTACARLILSPATRRGSHRKEQP